MTCEHPECEADDCGVEIQSLKVCTGHIEWAMSKAFAPVNELKNMLGDPPPPCPDCGDRHQATTPCYP